MAPDSTTWWMLSAGAAATAVSLVVPAPPRVKAPAPPVPTRREGGLVTRYRWLWAALAAVGPVAFLGGPVGMATGAAAAVGVWVVIGRAEPVGARRRRRQLQHELPHAVELLGAALAAGAAPGPALTRVAEALPGAVSDELAGVRHRLALGADPAEVWNELCDHPELAPLGRAMRRAYASGASIVDAVRHLADDLAESARLEVEDRARGVGVRAAVPLGLCLLPAFLLLGIVPMVVGAIGAIRW